MNNLVDEIERHLRQMAPHVQKRRTAQLLGELLALYEKTWRELDLLASVVHTGYEPPVGWTQNEFLIKTAARAAQLNVAKTEPYTHADIQARIHEHQLEIHRLARKILGDPSRGVVLP